MKLPTYQQMGFVSHPTVSPEQAAAPGKAMARFAEVASGVVGGIAGDMYEQEAVSEYGRANAEIAQRAEGLREFYLQNYRMTREQAGDLWQDEWAEAREVTTTNALGQEETQMVETIPTWRISADHFDRELGNSYKEIEGNLRTRKAKNSFAETFHYELQPKWQGAADASQFEMSQAMRRAQYGEDGLKLQQQPDEELALNHVELGVATGIVPPENAAEYSREYMEGWAVNDYTRDLLDENMPIDAREALLGEIAADPYLGEDAAQKLTAAANKAIYADHSELVSDSIIDRDLGRMNALRAEYTQEDYQGPLKAGQRQALIAEMDRAVKGWQVGATAESKYESERAQRDLSAMIESFTSGGAVTLDLLAKDAPQKIEEAFPNGPQNKTERALYDEISATLAAAPLYSDLSQAPVAAAEHRVASLTNSVKTSDQALIADNIVRYNEDLNVRKTQDTLQTAVTSGVVDEADVPPLDPNNPETLRARVQAGRAAASHYGVNGQLLAPEDQLVLSGVFDSSDAAGKLAVIATVTSAVDLPEDQATAFNELLDVSSNHLPMAGLVAANGSESAALDILQGNEFRNSQDGQLQLENKGWDKVEQKDAALRLTERAARLFPGQSGAAVQSALDLSALWISRGMDPDKAEARALDRISGGEVKGSGTSDINKTPVIGMDTATFRRQQQGISNAYYESIGWDYDEDPRNLVARGQVVFLDHGSGERGKYNLWDTRSNQAIADSYGRPVVVTWSQRGTDAGKQGIIDRSLRAIGVEEREIQDPKWQQEQERRRQRKVESKRQREAEKERRREEGENWWGKTGQNIDWFNNTGGETGSFAP